MNTINLTPTWEGLMPAFIALIENGTAEGRATAIKELTRMSQIADMAVARDKAEKEAEAKPQTCLVVAWTENHGENDMRDFWQIESNLDAANEYLSNRRASDKFYCGAVAQIITGTEPQWMDATP